MRITNDTNQHKKLKNIDQIISLFNHAKVSLVVHTGDITNSKSLDKFSDLNTDLIGVYGNNDRNEIGLKDIAIKNNFQFQEPPKSFSLFNRNIVVFHEPNSIEDFLAKNKNVDVVLHGHTHR